MKSIRRNFRSLTTATAVFATTCTSAFAAQDAEADKFQKQMQGHWTSISCELRPQTGQDGKVQSWYLKRSFRIDGTQLQAEFISYADNACQAPLWKLEFSAIASDAGPWAGLKGARKVDLSVDLNTRVTPLMQGFADFLNSAGEGSCGGAKAEVGKALDIKHGCKAFGMPANKIVKEAEVLAMVNDMLFFAARPVDGSSPTDDSKRINALQVPLVRAKP